MIEAVSFWNEPNNKSHWDIELDSDWKLFAEMARLAGQAVFAETPRLRRVLGGISPIDANFVLLGIFPHHTSPPKDPRHFADFCAEMTRRYAR